MVSMNNLISQIEVIKNRVNESKCNLEVRKFNFEEGNVIVFFMFFAEKYSTINQEYKRSG